MDCPAGVLLLDKSPGISSFGALRPVKKYFHGCRVGHTGTLDPFASGLMVVLVGKATRLAQYFSNMDKCYEAQVFFGRETDTLDPEGTVTATGPLPDAETVRGSLGAFEGWISQTPPRYSAIKVGGKRAYKAAREGASVVLPARSVRIDEIRLLDFLDGVAKIRVYCSKGTYIRSLARDIGRACGTVAHLISLRRLSVGAFNVEDPRVVRLASDGSGPIDPENAPPAGALPDAAATMLIAPLEALQRGESIPVARATDENIPAICNGAVLAPASFGLDGTTKGTFAVAAEQGRLLAIVDFDGARVRYRVVM